MGERERERKRKRRKEDGVGERHVPPASVSEYVFQHDRFSLFLFHVNLRRERERDISRFSISHARDPLFLSSSSSSSSSPLEDRGTWMLVDRYRPQPRSQQPFVVPFPKLVGEPWRGRMQRNNRWTGRMEKIFAKFTNRDRGRGQNSRLGRGVEPRPRRAPPSSPSPPS